MSDLFAGLGSVLLDGPILALLLLFTHIVVGGICYWRGRLRQVEVEKRRRVQEAYEARSAELFDRLVPGQRAESD